MAEYITIGREIINYAVYIAGAYSIINGVFKLVEKIDGRR